MENIGRVFHVDNDVFSNFHCDSDESFTALFPGRVSFRHARSNFVIDTWLKTVAKLVEDITPDGFNAQPMVLFSEQTRYDYAFFRYMLHCQLSRKRDQKNSHRSCRHGLFAVWIFASCLDSYRNFLEYYITDLP